MIACTAPGPGPNGTVATEVLPEVHVPPGSASFSVLVVPLHTYSGPVIAGGIGFTVTVVIACEPPHVLVAVRVNMPELASVVASDGLAPAAVKPPGPFQIYPVAPVALPLSVTIPPAHTDAGVALADTAVGVVITVTLVVTGVQPGVV